MKAKLFDQDYRPGDVIVYRHPNAVKSNPPQFMWRRYTLMNVLYEYAQYNSDGFAISDGPGPMIVPIDAEQEIMVATLKSGLRVRLRPRDHARQNR